MRHCPTEAYDFLESRGPGSYNSLIRFTLENNGIVHAAPDCFLLAISAPDDPKTAIIIFQCSELPALWRLAKMYRHRFNKVRFRRDFKNKYKERNMLMSRLLSKSPLATITPSLIH